MPHLKWNPRKEQSLLWSRSCMGCGMRSWHFPWAPKTSTNCWSTFMRNSFQFNTAAHLECCCMCCGRRGRKAVRPAQKRHCQVIQLLAWTRAATSFAPLRPAELCAHCKSSVPWIFLFCVFTRSRERGACCVLWVRHSVYFNNVQPGSMIEWANSWAKGITYRRDANQDVGGFFAQVRLLTFINFVGVQCTLKRKLLCRAF